MKMHPRFMHVQKASAHMQLEITKMAAEYDLTAAEHLQILNESIASTLKYLLRAERHPDNPNTPADTA